MITLGIGELVASCALILRGFFGGEGGISTNRMKLLPAVRLEFRPADPGLLPDRGLDAHLHRSRCTRSRARRSAACATPCATIPSASQFVGYDPHVGALSRLLACPASSPASPAALAAINFEIVNSALCRRGAVRQRAVRDLYRRRRLLLRADSRRDVRHLSARSCSVRLDQGLAALLRPVFIVMVMFAPGGIAGL